jgi:hypothetical protein
VANISPEGLRKTKKVNSTPSVRVEHSSSYSYYVWCKQCCIIQPYAVLAMFIQTQLRQRVVVRNAPPMAAHVRIFAQCQVFSHATVKRVADINKMRKETNYRTYF